MDFMEKITELRAKKGQLLTQAQALVDEGKIEEANEFTSQMEAINTSIAGLEALAKASQEGAEPVYDGALHGGKPKDEGKGEDKPFTSLGEQLQAVYNRHLDICNQDIHRMLFQIGQGLTAVRNAGSQFKLHLIPVNHGTQHHPYNCFIISYQYCVHGPHPLL